MTTERETVSYKVEDGALMDAPQWCSHDRGTNWCAVITGLDPKAPGGFARTFVDKARGAGLYVVAGFRAGQALMFCGDYVSSGGRKHYNRTVAVVVSVTDTELVLELWGDDYRGAYKAAQALTAPAVANPQQLPLYVPVRLTEVRAGAQVTYELPPTVYEQLQQYRR